MTKLSSWINDSFNDGSFKEINKKNGSFSVPVGKGEEMMAEERKVGNRSGIEN